MKLIYCLFAAEFIIHLSETNNTLEDFKKVLAENGAEFSESFVANLLRIIQHMKPTKNTTSSSSVKNGNADNLALKFPGLAIPNKPQKLLIEMDNLELKKEIKRSDNDVDDIMDLLEAQAPSSSGKSKEISDDNKHHSESESKQLSRKRQHERPEHRDRSRDRRTRRSKSKERKTIRNRSRSRHRSRSRSRHRSKSRSRRRSREGYRRGKHRSPSRSRESRSKQNITSVRDSSEVEDDPVPGKVFVSLL